MALQRRPVRCREGGELSPTGGLALGRRASSGRGCVRVWRKLEGHQRPRSSPVGHWDSRDGGDRARRTALRRERPWPRMAGSCVLLLVPWAASQPAELEAALQFCKGLRFQGRLHKQAGALDPQAL